MKVRRLYLLLFMGIFCSCVQSKKLTFGAWTLTDKEGVNIFHDDVPIVRGLCSEYNLNGSTVSTRQYSRHKVAVSAINDEFGTGRKWTIAYTSKGKPALYQSFRVYKDYLLTDIKIVSDETMKTNYMAPIVVSSTDSVLNGKSRRTLFVPYDNDAWIRYRSVKDVGEALRSYEVSCVYDADSRRGVVIGAVEHDKWKNAVELTNHSRSLKAFSGVADKPRITYM